MSLDAARKASSNWFTKLRKSIGRTGIAFLIALVLTAILNFMPGLDAIKLLLGFVLFFTGIICAFRMAGYVLRHSLWSLRNRLLFVYALLGVLPILLIIMLVGAAAWALTNELAIYLANAELDRSLETIQTAAESLRDLQPDQRRTLAPRLTEYFRRRFPELSVHIKDRKGELDCPNESGELNVPPKWSNAHGLLSRDEQFFGWAHIVSRDTEITVICPFSSEFISNLVPNLGVVDLYETRGGTGQPVGAKQSSDDVNVRVSQPDPKQDLQFKLTRHPGREAQLPPPVNRFDVQIQWFSTHDHMDFERPGASHPAVFSVRTRPSAVISAILSRSQFFSTALFYFIIILAILFLLVELVAGIIGFRLATRVTDTVNSLYGGTRRVIHGDFGHRVTVRGSDQVGELTQSFNQMTDNLERLLSVEKEKERLQTELEIAREVQGQLYPKQLPPSSGLALTVECDPARMVSGDYYDYQLLTPDQLAFAIGDVAGKGISAALLMATLQSALRAQMNQYIDAPDDAPDVSPADLVSKLNKQIYANTAPEKYATFFFGLYDAHSQVLTYTNAGHLPPLLFRHGEVTQLEINGTVVGAFPFSKYESSRLPLQPGDLLVCYTDGITEPENAYGEMFGEERLIELVKKQAQQDPQLIIRAIMEAVRKWTGTPELQDDMTLLIARHGGAVA